MIATGEGTTTRHVTGMEPVVVRLKKPVFADHRQIVEEDSEGRRTGGPTATQTGSITTILYGNTVPAEEADTRSATLPMFANVSSTVTAGPAATTTSDTRTARPAMVTRAEHEVVCYATAAGLLETLHIREEEAAAGGAVG